MRLYLLFGLCYVEGIVHFPISKNVVGRWLSQFCVDRSRESEESLRRCSSSTTSSVVDGYGGNRHRNSCWWMESPLLFPFLSYPSPPSSKKKKDISFWMTSTKTAATTTSPMDDCKKQENNNNNNNNNVTTLKIHTFVHPQTGQVWKAINTAKRRFFDYLEYSNVLSYKNASTTTIITQQYRISNDQQQQQQKQQELWRDEWRDLWKKRRLLTDRTEVLAVYPSDRVHNNNNHNNNKNGARRGGFADLLHLYRQRFLAILEDEDYHHPTPPSSSKQTLISWLQSQYPDTKSLMAEQFAFLPEKQQLALLKQFLTWFRSFFPYFYDRCGVCGSSLREESQQNNNNGQQHIVGHAIAHEDDDPPENNAYQTFLGYVYPNEHELTGKACRTELYRCHKCRAFTRFPRYNAALYVMEHRKGRCGEYSMLLFRFLRALDHETRWVVDWADHVWVEVYLPSSRRWVHLDPCEAAVDENLIYQGWGKKQMYILGFYAPLVQKTPQEKDMLYNHKIPTPHLHTPIIQDITASYTTDTMTTIKQRREESQKQVDSAILDATESLKSSLSSMGLVTRPMEPRKLGW